MVEEILLTCKNLDNQGKSARPKSLGSEVVLQAIETNLVSSTWGVSGELGITHSSVIPRLHDLRGKSTQSC